MTENKKYPQWLGWIINLATLITVVWGGLKIYGEFVKDRTEAKTVQFSDPEMKVQTEYHVKNTDPVAVVKQSYKDSVAEAKFRRTQDSMDLARDQLTKANAVEVFKVSKRLDTLTILLNDALEHIHN